VRKQRGNREPYPVGRRLREKITRKREREMLDKKGKNPRQQVSKIPPVSKNREEFEQKEQGTR